MFATSDCTPSCGDGISMERGLVEWAVVPQGLRRQEFRSFSGTTEVVLSQRGVVGAAEVVRPKRVVNAKSRNSRSLTRKKRGFGMTMCFFRNIVQSRELGSGEIILGAIYAKATSWKE